MGLDKKFRVEELTKSGSRAIFSENEDGEHTFIIPSPDGDRDGETYGYVEKPSYNNEELKRALDSDVDELFIPPENELPDVVPLATFERLQSDFATASLEIVSSSILIGELESTGSRLSAVSASLSILYSQSQHDYNELLVDFTSQSAELTETLTHIQELNAYTQSIETKFEIIQGDYEEIASTNRDMRDEFSEIIERASSLEIQVATVIAQVQQDSILTLSQERQEEIQAVQQRVSETQQEAETATGLAESVREGLIQLRGLMNELAQQILNSLRR